MIGGGGSSCDRADHGIAITEAEQASFRETGQGEHDFGNDGKRSQSKQQSLLFEPLDKLVYKFKRPINLPFIVLVD